MIKTYLNKSHTCKSLLRVCFSLVFITLSQQTYSQSLNQKLNIDNYIISILKNNPGVQKILIENDIAKSTLESSMGIDDAVLTSSISASHTESNQVLGFEASKSDDTRLNLSYDRLVSDTGSRISVGYVNQYTDRDPALTTLGNQYYQPSLTVRLTQPLLKNAGGIQDQVNIKLDKLNVKLTVLNSQEDLESYITQLATLYIDWYLAGRELEISKEVYQQAIEQEKLTRTKVKRQVIEPYELLRAQETREDYFSRWQQARGRFSGLTRQIQYQMNLNGQSNPTNLLPQNPKNSRLLNGDLNNKRLNNINNDYLDTTSRLKNILDALKAQQIILLETKENALLSDLNLSLNYTRHGVDDVLSDAHGSSLNKDDYSIMLEYKLPLGKRQASGLYQSQIASKRQVESDIQQRLIDAKANLANLQAQSSHMDIALQSIDKKITFARNKLEKENHLYKIGKLDLFELLKDQTSQMESRLNREQLFTQNLILQLKIGELLDHNLETYTSSSDSVTELTTGSK